MVAKRITPLLLAASVLVCGFSGGFIDKQAAYGITRVDELRDVSCSNWAYDALKSLVEKYNVIEGFPDKTFRGNKPPSRYEMAAALDATIKAMGKELARLGGEKADKEDLATVARLQQEFAAELATLQAKTNALEGRATKIEAKNDEQDNRLAILEKTRVYGDMSFGGYSDISGNPGSAFSDAISAVGRTRLNVDYNAVEDKGGSIVGPGTIHTRLVAAFGRVSPLESEENIARNAYSGVSEIAADSSLYNEGIRPSNLINILNGNPDNAAATVSGGNLRVNAYIDSAYYSQVLRAQVPGLPKDQAWRTTFTTHMGLIPWRDIYFKSPFQGDENTQFQNTALINNPAILNNFNIPRIAVVMGQGLGRWTNLQLKADVSALDTSDVVNGIGFTTEGDLGYNLGFLNNKFGGCKNLFNVAGNVFGGYYFVHPNGGGTNNLINVTTAGTATLPTTAGVGDLAQGFYVGANQELYKGIGVFGSYAMNNTGPTAALLYALQNGTGANTVYFTSTTPGSAAAGSLIFGIRQAFTAGLQVPVRALPSMITFNKRQRDVLGVAWASIYPNTSTGTPAAGNAGIAAARNPENVIEGYYKLQINDNFAFIPSSQIRFTRMGNETNNVDVVIGLRTSFTF